MENQDNNIKNTGRSWGGVVIIVIGLCFLLNNIGLDIPDWIFSWSTLMIALGIFIGLRRNFRGLGWLVLLLLGIYFTLDDIPGLDIDISKYALGLGLVIVGGFLIFRPKYKHYDKFTPQSDDSVTEANPYKSTKTRNNDVIETSTFFGGSHQTVYSKNFQGGDITAVFGGADINMTQADFNEVVTLDVTAVFGGIKLIVPPNWIIKSNVTALFGSVEDKRGHLIPAGEIQKTLVLDGTAMFGGIEIKSF